MKSSKTLDNKTLDQLTPERPPKKPFKAFMKAEFALFGLGLIVGILAYLFYFQNR